MKPNIKELVRHFQRLHEKKAKLEEEILKLDVEMYALFRVATQEKDHD